MMIIARFVDSFGGVRHYEEKNMQEMHSSHGSAVTA